MGPGDWARVCNWEGWRAAERAQQERRFPCPVVQELAQRAPRSPVLALCGWHWRRPAPGVKEQQVRAPKQRGRHLCTHGAATGQGRGAPGTRVCTGRVPTLPPSSGTCCWCRRVRPPAAPRAAGRGQSAWASTGRDADARPKNTRTRPSTWRSPSGRPRRLGPAPHPGQAGAKGRPWRLLRAPASSWLLRTARRGPPRTHRPGGLSQMPLRSQRAPAAGEAPRHPLFPRDVCGHFILRKEAPARKFRADSARKGHCTRGSCREPPPGVTPAALLPARGPGTGAGGGPAQAPRRSPHGAGRSRHRWLLPPRTPCSPASTEHQSRGDTVYVTQREEIKKEELSEEENFICPQVRTHEHPKREEKERERRGKGARS